MTTVRYLHPSAAAVVVYSPPAAAAVIYSPPAAAAVIYSSPAAAAAVVYSTPAAAAVYYPPAADVASAVVYPLLRRRRRIHMSALRIWMGDSMFFLLCLNMTSFLENFTRYFGQVVESIRIA